MPFARPELAQLYERTIADVETRVPGGDARNRRSILGVVAAVFAEAAHSLFAYLGFIADQVFPDTAEKEYLERWASIWGVPRRSASFARAPVRFTGADGSIITAGTLLQRADGFEYLVQHEGIIVGGLVDLVVEARLAGVPANVAPGTKLALVSPIPSVDPEGIAQAGGVDGADEESDKSFRAQVLDRIQEPPHGGAFFDYVKWAKEVPGVTDAWCTPLDNGSGTVGLRFVRRGDGADAAMLPDGAEVAEVQAYVDAKRPVTASLLVSAPTAAFDAMTIHVSPDTSAVRAAIIAELQDLYLREASPGAVMLLSKIREAVSRAAGESDNVVSVPAANVTHLAHQMPMVGVITWV